jgi:hypothetical protein
MCILISHSSDSRLAFLINTSIDIVYQSSSVLSNILSASLLLVIAYSLGHFIATISHISIDRLLVSGVFGYPIQRLLKLPRRMDQFQIKKSTSIYIFVCVLLILVRPVIHYHIGTPLGLDSNNCPSLYSICNPTYYVTIFCVLFVFIGMKILHAFLVSDPYYVRPSRIVNKCGLLKVGVNLYTWPARKLLIPLIHVFETFLGTERQFPTGMIEEFSKSFKEKFGLDYHKSGTENYWLSFFHINASDPNATRMLFNWLHIYGFARNMGAACFFIMVYILYRLHRMEDGDYMLMLVIYTLNFYLMIFFTIRYWMIYSTYYSKSIIRSFYVRSRMPD